MFFHNIIKNFCFFNTFYDIIKNNNELHYDGCFDCCREIMILIDYITKNKNPKYDINEIKINLQNDIILNKLVKYYKKINKITYYNLSNTNRKCPKHNMTKQKYFNLV